MKKIHCVICVKYKKIKNPKVSKNFKKILVFSIISCKCENEGKKIFIE